MDFIVEGKGVFIGKHQGRIRLTQNGKVTREIPILHLKRLIVMDRGIGLSSDVVEVCSEEGIPIHFLSHRGTPIAGIYAAGLTGTVMTRRAQLSAYTTPLGGQLARLMVSGKIQNQRNFLRYTAKYRQETDPERYQEMNRTIDDLSDHLEEVLALPGECIEQIRAQLLSIEGRAAYKYWSLVGMIIPEELHWPGRETRGARDPLNASLNYGYGILYSLVEQAIILAGLDPYGGFLHADRPGKPSLVLDLIEEFRQTVVDRTIIGLVNKRVEIVQTEDGMLSEKTRKILAEKVLQRMESSELYEKKRQPLRFILQCQARHLACFLREENEYKPFIAGW